MATRTVKGGCHCGAVRYSAEGDFDNVKECNCSHCAIKGGLWSFIPAENFNLESGEDKLTDYLFNRKAIHHLFCSVCGVQAFGRGAMPDGSAIVAVNVRTVDGVDLASLKREPVDGKSL